MAHHLLGTNLWVQMTIPLQTREEGRLTRLQRAKTTCIPHGQTTLITTTEPSTPEWRGDVPWPRGGRGHAGGAATGRCGAHSISKNAILEIRAGTGGDEAALFAADLFRMYQRYAENRGWKVEVMDASDTGIGGFKEIVSSISGSDVFARLKYESGVHRVQRVPETESSGRIHTSAATVAVLPEAEEVDVDIADADLRVDTYRASGPGGQSVNTTDSAIRITHLPTGIVVTQQDEKSQHKNRAKAMRVLRARLYEHERQLIDAERAQARKSQVGSGDRSERIRTYNYPQGRVTDHRINLTLHKLERILDGEGLDELIDALVTEDQAARLAEDETADA